MSNNDVSKKIVSNCTGALFKAVDQIPQSANEPVYHHQTIPLIIPSTETMQAVQALQIELKLSQMQPLQGIASAYQASIHTTTSHPLEVDYTVSAIAYVNGEVDINLTMISVEDIFGMV